MIIVIIVIISPIFLLTLCVLPLATGTIQFFTCYFMVMNQQVNEVYHNIIANLRKVTREADEKLTIQQIGA